MLTIPENVFSVAVERTGQPRDEHGRFASTSLFVKPTMRILTRWADKFVDAQAKMYEADNVVSLKRDVAWDAEVLKTLKFLERFEAAKRQNRWKVMELLRRKHRIGAKTAFTYLRQVYEQVENSVYYVPDYYKVSRTDVLNDLLTLVSVVPCLYDRSKKALFVPTEDVIISERAAPNIKYNFGSFRIYFSPTATNYQEVKAIANTPRYPTMYRPGDNRTIVHPHVNSGNICFGAGKYSAQIAFQQGRFFDLLQLVMAVLNTYGGDSGLRPYAVLNSWKGVCDYKVDPKTGNPIPADYIALEEPAEVLTCSGCGGIVGDLVRCHTRNCRNERCFGCIYTCNYEDCETRMCNDHIYTCERCNEIYCADHMVDYVCMACSDYASEYESEEEDEEEDEEDEG